MATQRATALTTLLTLLLKNDSYCT